MIVDTDDRGSTVGNRIRKYFTGMDKAMVQQAYGNNPVVENLPGTVQRETDEMFLSFILKVGNKREDIFRSCHSDISSRLA